ncbi:hypothetical protein NSU_3497 [Novosphingobium pentaromativorans US6-1]|uniref:Uncharacterized protein n=1 Tax=Novosphingobium pentaromativorans US6-1 TaxID=1088721 RepID=G6EGG3_9SPHN|nr:hypothetical protein NSU_3497 [Novosphingobium pentaromativorans US6-1]
MSCLFHTFILPCNGGFPPLEHQLRLLLSRIRMHASARSDYMHQMYEILNTRNDHSFHRSAERFEL